MTSKRGSSDSLPGFRQLPVSLRRGAAERKYAEAVALYGGTDLPVRRVAELCGVTPSGLSSHIAKYHRELLLARYGLDSGDADLLSFRLKGASGQSVKAHMKYGEAIEACGDIAYIEYNVSQVARMFDLDGTALASQLRVHYPDVIPNREKLRRRLGIADNTHRGPRKWCVEAYADALVMYRDSDLTIGEVADRCDVSKSGFCQYMRFYHKEVIEHKSARRVEVRVEARERKLATPASAAPTRRETAAAEKYAPAIDSLRLRPRQVAAVAAEFGFNPEVFRQYLKAHAPELAERQGMTRREDGRLVKRASSERYAEAIREYATTAEPLKSIAARHGLVYNSLLGFITRNCPAERERHRRIASANNLTN